MAEALVSGVLERLSSIGLQVAESGVRLVVGVNEEVERIRSTFQAIRAVLVDAEKRQVKEQAVKLWLDKLQNVAYDIEDLLDEWNTAILKNLPIQEDREEDQVFPNSNSISFLMSRVRSLQPSGISVPRLIQRHDIAVKIKDLNKRLQVIAKGKDDYGFIANNLTRTNDLEPERPKTTCFIDVSEICGRDQDKNTLISMLLTQNKAEERGIPVIAIVGMGGMGKTTLAQMVYNHRELTAYFQKKIWVCVSDPFDEMRVAKAILESLTGVACGLSELNTVLEKIHESIAEKRFLLVLDDVWTQDEWKWQSLKSCLSSGSQGSKILVTTRKENVAAIMGSTKIFHLGKLSEEACWFLFSQIAFSQRNNRERESLAEIGRKIADKCNGLPLAAKTLGGLLRFKRSREQWQRILDSHMWDLDDEAENGLFSPLLLSYYDSPSPLRQCFSYCAIFPKDHKIEKDFLIKLWMAQGYLGGIPENKMEIIGEEYFDNLAMRSFFQEFEKDEIDDCIIRCKMHDIVHDFAQFLRKTECFIVSSSRMEEQRAEYHQENARHLTLILDDEHVAIPDPIYHVRKLRSLLVDSSHYGKSNLHASLPTLFDRLTSLRMLDLSNQSRFRGKNSIKELPKEIGMLIHLRSFSVEGNTGLAYLPDELGDLCNLQTLNIRLCSSLNRLPDAIGRLTNLRHLQNAETYGCNSMPIGMERLTHLQTLDELVVGNWYTQNRGQMTIGSSLAALEGLVHLRGNLKIVGLGKVRRRNTERGPTITFVKIVSINEAEKAGLRSKTGLRNLTLSFNTNAKYTSLLAEDEAFVLEALQPPPYLEYLNINRMNGPTLFPSWMSSLTMLKRVILWDCVNWESLPPMGKLPCLEYLEIGLMKKVKKVGREFIGTETERQTSSSSSVPNNIAFPHLKHLKFQFMEEWEKWECGNNIIPAIMPRLCSLKINSCLKLKSLPPQLLQKTTLRVLDIFDCPILKARCLANGRGEDWHYVSLIPTIIIDGEDMKRDE